MVFGPGLHSKLALSKQRLQHNNCGLASGVGKVVFFSAEDLRCAWLAEEKCPYACVVASVCGRERDLGFSGRYNQGML